MKKKIGKNNKAIGFYENGDVLRATGIYVEDDQEVEKQDRLLILHTMKVENDESTKIWYVVVMQSEEWDDPYDFAEDIYCRILSEEFLEKNAEKIGHIDVSPMM